MGKFNTLASIFCFVLFCFPDLYYGTFHDKKINLKIELVDKDLLLSHEHLKKEKNIVQNGKKIKIKIFEKIKENVLERALIVQEVDKIKGISASKSGSAASLQNLRGDAGDDAADRADDNSDDSANDNDDDDNDNDAASEGGEQAGSEEEYPAHDTNDMKVISTEESTENDVHMLRKVYQKKSDEESTIYCYMRYTFNLNLDKLSENNKSELFKGLDKSLDYMSFLPKEDEVTDTEEILDHEYKQMDNPTESNNSILSNVELRNDNLNSCPNSEYVETIDDIVSYLESASGKLAIPSSIRNKLLSERDLLTGSDEVEAGDASSTGNAPYANVPDADVPDDKADNFALYEILANLKDSFMMKKKVINLLRNGSTNAGDANTDRVAEKDLDEIFIDSVERTFDCYDVLKGSERLDSILASEGEEKTLVEESPNTKDVEIKNHQFIYAPGETSAENSLASGDDMDKCEVFFKAILKNEVFAGDSTLSQSVRGGHFQMLDDGVRSDGLSDTRAKNSGGEDATYADSFFNGFSRMPIVEYASTKLRSAFMGDDRHMDVTASERDIPERDTSNWQERQKVLADTASFADMSTGMRSCEEDDKGDEVDVDKVDDDDDDDDDDGDDDGDDDDDDDDDEDDDEDDDDNRDEDDDGYEEYDDEYCDEDTEECDEEHGEEPNHSLLGAKDLLGNLLKTGSNHLKDKATKLSSTIKDNFNIDKLSKKANKMVGKIKKASKKGFKKYKEKLVSKVNLDKLKKEAKNGVENLKDIGKNGIRKLKDAAKRGGRRLKKEGKEFVDKGKKKMKKVAKKGIDKAEKLAKKGIDKAKKLAKKGINKTEKLAQKGIDKAQKAAQAGVNKVQKGIDKAQEAVQKGIDKAQEVVQKGIDKAQEAAQAGVNKVQKGIDKAQEAAQAGVNKAQEVVQKGIDKAQEVAQAGVNKVQKGIDKVQEAAQAGVNKAQEVVQNGMDKAESVVQKGIDKAQEVAQAGVNKVQKGIDKAQEEVQAGVNKMQKGIDKAQEAAQAKVNKAQKGIDKAQKKVEKRKTSFLSVSGESNENTLNGKKIKSEIKKINKEYKKLREMKKKVKEELKKPMPSDKKIIQEFDDFEKSGEEKKE